MNARKYTPENVINTTDQFLSLYNKAENHTYVETGIQDFDDMCLGLMQGHFTLFRHQDRHMAHGRDQAKVTAGAGVIRHQG